MDLLDINPKLFDSVPPPVEQIHDEMIKNGFPAVDIVMDGKIHRFATSDKVRDDAGWYIFFGGVAPAGMYGDFRAGIEHSFCCNVNREISFSEMSEQKKIIEEAKAKRDIERTELKAAAAKRAKEIIDNAIPATDNHQYLSRKRVLSHGLKIADNGSLIIPVNDYTGEVSSLQFVSTNGDKKFLYGGAVKGCFYTIGSIGKKIFVCEGYATGATIFEATGAGTIICFSAGNVPEVCKLMRMRNPTAEIVIVADNDENGTGLKYANEAANQTGATVIIAPVIGQDINDYMLSGGDVKKFLEPEKKEWLISADEFCKKPAPIKWLVKHWIPEQSLIMVHGASGSGKTFLTIDMCLHMAASFCMWHGSTVSPATVVYLAGEGHNGLRARIAAWKQHYNPGCNLNLWISKTGTDLDVDMYRQKVIEYIRSLPNIPKLIVVDTLHRFMSGDENSSQDAGKMISSCDILRDEFGCSVLLVHHTGNSEDAQKRARGSSAWRAALDIEISVKGASKSGNVITVEQMKNKDSELAGTTYVEKKVVTINGWADDDGEPVTSLVLVAGTKPERKEPIVDKVDKIKKIEEAWAAHSNCFDSGGMPKLTRENVKTFLMENGTSESTAQQYAYRRGSRFLVSDLLESGRIKATDEPDTFIVCDPASILRMTQKKC